MLQLKGHGYLQTIYAISFSPDGKRLASVGLDGNVRFWDLATGKQVGELRANYDTRLASYSADGRLFAWPDYDGLNVLDLETDATTSYPVGHNSRVTAAVFSTDPASLICYRYDYGTEPWSAAIVTLVRATNAWEAWPDSESCVSGPVASPDGTLIATGHKAPKAATSRRSSARHDHVIRVWDVKQRKQVASLGGHGAQITALAFSPDGKHLAATSGTSVWVWDVNAQQPIKQLKFADLHCKSVAFSPDGRWLATARNDQTVRLFDARTWAEGPAYDWKIGPVVVVAFARDGMRAACGSSKGKVVVWDVDE
jgi:WD40 repeat protein